MLKTFPCLPLPQEADAAAGGTIAAAAVGRTVSEDFPDIVEPARASMRGRGRGRGRGGGRGRGARRKREDDETEMFNPEEGRGKRRKRGAWEFTLRIVHMRMAPNESSGGRRLAQRIGRS